MRFAAREWCGLLFVLLSPALLPACALRTGLTIDGGGSFGDTPTGPTAVLQVAARSVGTPKSGRATWGLVDTMNADERFAELLAHTAAEEGGLHVLHPVQVAERLQAAGLEPTLQHDEARLRERAQILGCASYLTADISRWRYSYVFFSSSAVIEYRLACRVPDSDRPVWEVEVRRAARGMSDRDIALLALRETFRWLRERTTPTTGAHATDDHSGN